MKHIVMLAGILIILATPHYGNCSIQQVSGIQAVKIKNKQTASFQKAKKELENLLLQRKKLQVMRKEIAFKLRQARRSKHVTEDLPLQSQRQLKMIRSIEEELIDNIAQLIKKHTELMKYLPPDVGLLPIIPFLPVLPIRRPLVMPPGLMMP